MDRVRQGASAGRWAQRCRGKGWPRAGSVGGREGRGQRGGSGRVAALTGKPRHLPRAAQHSKGLRFEWDRRVRKEPEAGWSEYGGSGVVTAGLLWPAGLSSPPFYCPRPLASPGRHQPLLQRARAGARLLTRPWRPAARSSRCPKPRCCLLGPPEGRGRRPGGAGGGGL